MFGEEGWGEFSTPSLPFAGLKPIQKLPPLVRVLGVEISGGLEEGGEPGLSGDYFTLLTF